MASTNSFMSLWKSKRIHNKSISFYIGEFAAAGFVFGMPIFLLWLGSFAGLN